MSHNENAVNIPHKWGSNNQKPKSTPVEPVISYTWGPGNKQHVISPSPENKEQMKTPASRQEKLCLLNGIMLGIKISNAYLLTGRPFPNPPENHKFEDFSNEKLDSLIADYTKI